LRAPGIVEGDDVNDNLDDDEWSLIAPFLVESGPKRGRPPRDHRRVLEGVLWIARTGSPWRDLPPEYGNWSSVYRQFLRWTRLGLWERMIAVAVRYDAERPCDRLSDGAPSLVQRIAAVRALGKRRRAPIVPGPEPVRFARPAG
jgi:transposase